MSRRFIRTAFVILFVALFAGVGLAAYSNLFVSQLQVRDLLVYFSAQALFCFLLVLTIRYLIMAVFAFLEHVRHMSDDLEPVDFPPISVIVPAFNEGPVIEACIHSIMQLQYPNFEAIIIDDGSTDDTFEKAEALSELYGPSRLRVFQQQNGGKASALNAGIEHAHGELVVCSDADSRLEPQALFEAVRHFSDPTVAAVAGNVKVVNRVNTITRLQALEYIEGLNLVRTAQALAKRVTVIPGPIGMFRRSVLEELGGYHTDTFAEDCDLTLRIMLAGWKIKYESRAIAWTEAPEHTQALFQQRYRWGRGILQAIIKHRHRSLSPTPDFLTFALFWVLVFESIALPVMDMAGIVLFVFAAANSALSPLIALWWAQLAVLDTVVALFCVSMEREDLRLVLYAVAYRLYFVPFVDTMRFFAWIDELFDVQMAWLRPQRLGRT